MEESVWWISAQRGARQEGSFRLLMLLGMAMLSTSVAEKSYGLFDVEVGGSTQIDNGLSNGHLAVQSRVDLFSINDIGPMWGNNTRWGGPVSYITVLSQGGYYDGWVIAPLGVAFGVGHESFRAPEPFYEASLAIYPRGGEKWEPKLELAYKTLAYSGSLALSWNPVDRSLMIGAFLGITFMSEYSFGNLLVDQLTQKNADPTSTANR